MAKNWFSLAKPAGTGKAVIHIYDQIGTGIFDDSGIAATDFVDALKDLGELEQIDLHIASPGGSVNDGLAIHHTLKSHAAKVIVHIDGIAASIASVIAMAGDEIHIPPSGLVMIHDPATLLMAGNAEALRKEADALDRVAAAMASIYADRTGQPVEKIRELMADETWMGGEEAVELGFADTLTEESKIAAHAQAEAAQRSVHAELVASAQLQAKDSEIARLTAELNALRTEPAKPAEIIRACSAAGVGTAMASTWIDQGLSMRELNRHLAFASDIRDKCAAANIDPGVFLAHIEDPARCFGLALADSLAREADASHIDGHLAAVASDPKDPHGWGRAMGKKNSF